MRQALRVRTVHRQAKMVPLAVTAAMAALAAMQAWAGRLLVLATTELLA